MKTGVSHQQEVSREADINCPPLPHKACSLLYYGTDGLLGTKFLSGDRPRQSQVKNQHLEDLPIDTDDGDSTNSNRKFLTQL
jgi:hypothetical protein